MAFSPFARFRNFTVENLKALLEVYPDQAQKLSWSEAGDIVEGVSKGYKKTSYQQACQFGIEDRGEGSFRVQSYLYTFDDDNLKKYMEFWIKTYYAPNPYVDSDDDSMLIFCELVKEILAKPDLRIDYYDFFNRRIGGKSDDILMNALKSYCSPLMYEKVGDRHFFYIEPENVEALRNQVAYIETEFPIADAKSKSDFFNRYKYENFCRFFDIDVTPLKKEDDRDAISVRMKGAENILLYGVPGCGKSHEIKTNYCDDDNYMERAVFHPDYTYSDFVGQILPKVSEEGKVTYEFEPGPFTRILEKAVNNGTYFYLVVEEINRGNAPAIFGDIFQLLDRDEVGESEYGISNEFIADYVYKDKNAKVKIPSNLFILATMNTSDQNVFTLDTAFKRRWSMKHIENNIDECDFAGHYVCDSDITWGVFAKTINKLIIEVNSENLSNEDNRLGAYFVKMKELNDSSLFGEKVLMYLWNDAFKYDHEKVFSSEYRTLDELIEGFKNSGFDIFVKDIIFVEDDIAKADSKEVTVEKYLSGKKEHLIAYYKTLRDMVKDKVPTSRESTTNSLQYAAWKSDDIRKSSFADLQIQSDKILIYTEPPRVQDHMDIGEVIPKDNHHNHYFKIIYNEEFVNDIVDVIVESYEQLRKGSVDA